jgi:hypothetical protein
VTTQTENTQMNHRRAVRFFWCFLIGATTVSLIGNIAHAVLPYLPRIVIQIGAATVPPSTMPLVFTRPPTGAGRRRCRGWARLRKRYHLRG